MELWDSSKTNKKVIEFVSGWDNKSKKAYDEVLIPYEIEAVKAYSIELLKQGYITENEFNAIKDGLNKIKEHYDKGELDIENYEDVHSLVESKLNEMYGSLVGNVNLGKSRNEEVCTIMRMWMRHQTNKIIKDLDKFISILESEVNKKGKAVIPGFTHHRVAMPTTYGQFLESYVSGLKRDMEKLEFWLKQYNKCSLGSAAGFGSSIKLNRERIAKELGFDGATENSIDTVTTRWEAESSLASNLAVLLNHLSTMSQDIIYLSSAGINIISIPKEYCTGSSLMPQKNNPDVLEVIKAKASVSHGILTSLLSLGRGNISGYNRDTQWTKYLIIDLVMEFENLFEVLSGLVKGIKIDESRSEELLENEKAYSAGKVIRKSIEDKKGFREEKLEFEKKLKDKL
jgi:argininosuccinate lyase